MGDILIRNIPDDLHEALKASASANHRSLSQEVGVLLRKSMLGGSGKQEKMSESAADAFAAMREAFGMTDEEHSQWQADIDGARKSVERPVPDFKW